MNNISLKRDFLHFRILSFFYYFIKKDRIDISDIIFVSRFNVSYTSKDEMIKTFQNWHKDLFITYFHAFSNRLSWKNKNYILKKMFYFVLIEMFSIEEDFFYVFETSKLIFLSNGFTFVQMYLDSNLN